VGMSGPGPVAAWELHQEPCRLVSRPCMHQALPEMPRLPQVIPCGGTDAIVKEASSSDCVDKAAAVTRRLLLPWTQWALPLLLAAPGPLVAPRLKTPCFWRPGIR